MPSPRVANCIFCDSLRQEIGNKISLMGLYSADIYFASEKPGFLPTFAVVAFLICDPDDYPTRLKLKVLNTDKTELINTDVQLADPVGIRAESVKVNIRVVGQMVGLRVPEEGDLEVYLETESGALRAGRLAVKFVSPAEAQAIASGSSHSAPPQPVEPRRSTPAGAKNKL